MEKSRLKIRTYGDPFLRKPARMVASVGPAEKLIIREMIPAMYALEGTGLAANQVGIDQQIFVADLGEGPFAVINPQITRASAKKTVMEEGCLSFPGLRFRIERPEAVRVKYLTESNETIEVDLGGIAAKVFQHEIDHLNGRMIIDHASKAEKIKFRDAIARIEALQKKGKPRA